MAWLSAEEQRVLQFVAQRFDCDDRDFQTSEVYEELGMTHERLMICIRRLESVGAAKLTDLGDDIIVRALPSSVDLVRDLEHQAEAKRSSRPDLVEQFKAAVRRNPWTARPIIVVLGLGVLFAIINQAWELVGKIAAAFGD